MKTAGIIAEYNPFHHGHLYHLKKTKELTGAKAVVCVLNGNFMQRGEPALTDKWSRTKMALSSGVDLVIELPLFWGIRSAEYFAEGAVKILAATGIVDQFVFGSEIGDLKPLVRVAEIFNQEPKTYKHNLKNYLQQGLSFPQAREKALIKFLTQQKTKHKNLSQLKKVVSGPNNILGIEYIKALQKYKIPLKPKTIKRTHQNYHTNKTSHKLASATAIRNKLCNHHSPAKIEKFVPENTFKILKQDFKKNKLPLNKDRLAYILLARLRDTFSEELLAFKEINNGLENRIINSSHRAGNWEQLIKNITTKSLTKTRIKRNLLHILFDLNQSEFSYLDQKGVNYLRILGFSPRGEKLLSQLKEKSSTAIITQPANYLKSVQKNSRDPLKKQLSYDILATDIYSLLYNDPEYRQAGLDFTTPIVKI